MTTLPKQRVRNPQKIAWTEDMLADLRTLPGTVLATTYRISPSAVSSKRRELGLSTKIDRGSLPKTRRYTGKLVVLNPIITAVRGRRLTYEQLVTMTGVSRIALQELLSGESDPRLSTVIACVEALDLRMIVPVLAR